MSDQELSAQAMLPCTVISTVDNIQGETSFEIRASVDQSSLSSVEESILNTMQYYDIKDCLDEQVFY